MSKMNDIFQVDYMPDEKKIKINLPEEVWRNIDTVIKTGEEVDEQLIKLLQSDKEELKRWIKRMKYHCNKVNELRIELNKYQKLLKRIESSPKMPIERWTGDEREIICPACKSYICYPEDIKTIDLKYRQFCGACGQKLNWESEVEHDA